MSELVIDTHALIWLLEKSKRLGPGARDALKQAASIHALHVAAITPWEVAMLVSKGRLTFRRDVGEWLEAALALPGLQLAPLSPAVAVASTRLPGDLGSDPADRIIVATARHLGAPLVTADENLLDYGRQGHLKTIDARR